MKTIIKNKKDFYKLAEEKNLKVSSWAKDLIENAVFDNSSSIEYVKKSVSEIGLPNGGTYQEITDMAKVQGLQLLSHPQALQYALEYSETDWVYLAINPITDSDGDRGLFGVGHDDDDLWLYGSYGDADDFWVGRFVFVFGLKKESNIMKRIMSKVEKNDNCWLWKGAKTKGYGRISKGKRNEGLLTVHRVVYECLIGKVPKGMVLDHLCRNRGCVNPCHLEIVTNKENILRGDGPTGRKAKSKIN